MKICSIEIKNFRLLTDFRLDLEDDLSLVIGKNNTGKTSLLSALEKLFAETRKISFDDFNVKLRDRLKALVGGEEAIPDEDVYEPLGLELRLVIVYEDDDDLGQVSPLIMSLDPDDKSIVLGFEYKISHSQIVSFREDFHEERDNYDDDVLLYMAEKHKKYFGGISKRSYLSNDFSVFTDLVKEKISLDEVISLKAISAKRNVTNRENDKTLSGQTAVIYKITEESEQQKDTVNRFKKTLRGADKNLNGIYREMFSKVLKSVERFGGISQSETSLTIASTLQHQELLDGNTTVFYRHETHDLPEHYNGLGYMNLISMIFEIDLLMTAFRRSLLERPAAINLLFIEEPEAHTHPQMQYVFIKNIKDLLEEGVVREDGLVVNLQTVISTHSSHIVAECNFDDIKYMKRVGGMVKCSNLKDLKKEYERKDPKGTNGHFKFLKQYLTLNRAELFFADKAIFVEGDTERVLLPAMMKKLDEEYPTNDLAPIMSQNVSIVEVGAHSQIFEKFISFLGIKTLILTDIDTGKTVPDLNSAGNQKLTKENKPMYTTEKCPPLDEHVSHTSNNALCFFHSKERTDIKHFLSLQEDGKKFLFDGDKWVGDKIGHIFTAFQTEEDGYRGRSFEDAFFSLNKEFLGTDSAAFPSLVAKHFDLYVAGLTTAYDFAEKGVDKKTTLAIDILLNSQIQEIPKRTFFNWKTPAYIREGLEWLRK
ncbi:ATP-dependent nuclease [Pseudomonas petrae]|uniref:ATP-dependent nuclease n=1 Tax=Pseudomonas petrae TaxID=2912190 RepID=UPI0023517B90|nr:ATP-dependent endonuclease [Pseudomonas petrae]